MSGDKPKDLFNEIDLRLNGVFGELGRALGEALTKLEDGGGEVHRSQTFKTAKGPMRAEAGIRVRVGGLDLSRDQKDTPEPINDPSSDHSSEARDIDATIVLDDAEWSLSAEMPGVAQEDVQLSEQDGQLVIEASRQKRTYGGRFDLPKGVKVSDITMSLKNGVLDLTAPLTEGGVG